MLQLSCEETTHMLQWPNSKRSLEIKKIKIEKRLIEIKLDQHNYILKHSRKVTSCQTCLRVFVQNLYLINEPPDLQLLFSFYCSSGQFEKSL